MGGTGLVFAVMGGGGCSYSQVPTLIPGVQNPESGQVRTPVPPPSLETASGHTELSAATMSLLGYMFPSVLRAICHRLTEAQPQGPGFQLDSIPLMGILLPFLGLSSFNCTLRHPPRLLEWTNCKVVKS